MDWKEIIKKHSSIIELLVKISVFVVALITTFTYIIGITTQTSDSMSPNIKFHDNVIYSRINTDYYLRDVIVYEYNGETYLGRLVGVPGDTIFVNGNGNLYQNGHLVYEDNIFLFDTSDEYELTLGENEYFVICDNRSYHTDSREFGAINKAQIEGIVILDVRRFEL